MSGLLNKIKNVGHHNQQNANLPPSSNIEALPNGLAAQQGRTVVNAPVVQETVRQDRMVEIQPVVHREVDQNVVHHVEKHIQEAAAPNLGGVVEMNPIIQQNIHTNVVNEVQPIIHRERAVPVAERVEQHLTQRVVAPPIHTHEVIYENRAGFQPGLQQQGLGLQQQQGLGLQQQGALPQQGLPSQQSGLNRF